MAADAARRGEFPATLARCLLGMVVAALLGCFIGYGLLIMIGQDTDVTVSDGYLSRAYTGRAGFIEQNLEYQQAADALRSHPGLRVLRTAAGTPLYWLDGQEVDPATLMDAEFVDAIEQLFAGSADALQGEDARTGEAIVDMQLHNIAVDDAGHVCFYLYYDTYGYLCIAYDEQNSSAEQENAIAIMEQWYLVFNYGDLTA